MKSLLKTNNNKIFYQKCGLLSASKDLSDLLYNGDMQWKRISRT